MSSQPLDADVLIIGGGLAGLIAGIHLSQKNVRVILIEKQTYPHQKVCGEYVSNEVLPYLHQLGIWVDDANPSQIRRFLFSTVSGETIASALPLGGFGLSRSALDHLLFKKALLSGVDAIQSKVIDVQFADDAFTVTTIDEKKYTAKVVIGAYGKRSSLDKQLGRGFSLKPSPWIGVKAHYTADFPDDLVALHNFNGGYCGLSHVEDGIINACYLTSYKSFKQYKNVDAFQQHVLNQNPFLSDFFAEATPVFDKPLTISQISFARKQPVENHILMCGDTAGVIHPLCGNGMAMAIHSAKIASELILTYYQTDCQNRSRMEHDYVRSWNHFFKRRLSTGRIVQGLMQRPAIASVLIRSLKVSPELLPMLIKQTHGEPLKNEVPSL